MDAPKSSSAPPVQAEGLPAILGLLDRLSGDALRAADPKDLARFRELCHHWFQLADSEAKKRNRPR